MHIVVAKEKFAKLRIVVGGTGADRLLLKATRSRSGIAIEGCRTKATVARPEAGADDLVRVGFAGDYVGIFARRCGTSGEAADGQIEASPEEVHRTHLSDES